MTSFQSFTPPQFVKHALVQERKKKLQQALIDYTAWLAEEMQDWPIQHLSPCDIESLTAEYLEGVE